MTNQTLIDELRQQAEWYRIEDPDNADPLDLTPDESNEIAALLERAADALSRPTEGCTWTQDRYGNWDTGCGQTHVLMHDGPRENGMRFCCYCGGVLAVELSGNSGAFNHPNREVADPGMQSGGMVRRSLKTMRELESMSDVERALFYVAEWKGDSRGLGGLNSLHSEALAGEVIRLRAVLAVRVLAGDSTDEGAQR